jgi:hypothetical protein
LVVVVVVDAVGDAFKALARFENIPDPVPDSLGRFGT